MSLEVKGLKELQKRLQLIPENVKQEVNALMDTVANGFVERAIAAAPTDEGSLIQGISYRKLGDMDFEIISSAFQTPYIEWGTRSRIKIPADQQAYAAKFKGRAGRGDYYDFLNSILDWVKRKGIASRFSVKTRKALKHTKSDDERLVETAEAIANSIIRHGIHPHPFFFPQMPIAQAEVNKSLKEVVKKALSK